MSVKKLRPIRPDQTHRILEDMQSVSLGVTHMDDCVADCKACPKAKKLKSGASLQKNLLEAICRDIMGMMNGGKSR